MTKTTIVKHEHQKSFIDVRVSKKCCKAIAEDIAKFYGLKVIFYGRYEYNATANSYVRIPERDETHVFKTQGDAYSFLLDLYMELTEAELAAC
jgi:hypothetical protein